MAIVNQPEIHHMPELSIIVPTCDRADLLDRCLSGIVQNTRCDFEIVVVDGASTDHTWHVLDQAKRELGDRLQVIFEDNREGFVRAANKGFRAARGRHLTWLNDDARPLPGAYTNAIAQLYTGPATIGLVALFHRWHSPRNVAYEKIAVDNPTVTTTSGPCALADKNGESRSLKSMRSAIGPEAGVTGEPASALYQLCHVRGTLYANFAVGRREVFEQLNFFDERFVFYAADPDLSLKAWHAGLSVIPAQASFIDHDEYADDRRSTDAAQGRQDNAALFAKWDLPPVNPRRNDFDPKHPCTIRGLRSNVAKAA
jgi:GT2 family glycosyltransferase